jgi:hypothetical protein
VEDVGDVQRVPLSSDSEYEEVMSSAVMVQQGVRVPDLWPVDHGDCKVGTWAVIEQEFGPKSKIQKGIGLVQVLFVCVFSVLSAFQ